MDRRCGCYDGLFSCLVAAAWAKKSIVAGPYYGSNEEDIASKFYEQLKSVTLNWMAIITLSTAAARHSP